MAALVCRSSSRRKSNLRCHRISVIIWRTALPSFSAHATGSQPTELLGPNSSITSTYFLPKTSLSNAVVCAAGSFLIRRPERANRFWRNVANSKPNTVNYSIRSRLFWSGTTLLESILKLIPMSTRLKRAQFCRGCVVVSPPAAGASFLC